MERKVKFLRSGGFSLVELMISIAIGIFLVSAMTALLVRNSATRNEMEKAGRQIENGRYAIELLSEDLKHAGYFGFFWNNPVGTLPTAYCSADVANLRNWMAFPVFGVNNASSWPNTCGGAAIAFKANTDILVIHRAATEAILPADAVTNVRYVQTTPGAIRVGGTGVANGESFDLKQKDLATLALLRKYVVHIYFIDQVGGIPVLKLAELDAGSFTITTLVEGIENLQVQYGIDNTNDGVPDVYVSAPSAWQNVMSVHLYLLARNTEISPDWDDSKKTYVLGDVTFTPSGADTKYKRHVYSTVVGLANPLGRKGL